MRIALDAMGGDLAPGAPVAGAVQALRTFPDVEAVLVGDEKAIAAEIEQHGLGAEEAKRLRTVRADHAAGKGEDAARIIRSEPSNSARLCAELLREGEADGVVNTGSTAVAVAAAHLVCGRLAGIRRPGIAVPFPRPGGATVVVDCGANPDARPEDLHQYAIMASRYVRAALGVEEPRIGILSIGEEEHKGNRLVAETWEVFRRSPLPRFVGNVEPREFFEDRADVVVADGFAGNVALKAAEGMAAYLLGALGREEGCPKGLLQALRQRVDYAEYGGAPLLGVKGAYLVGHGRSDARAVFAAVRAARAYVAGRVAEHIVEDLASLAPAGEGA